VIPRIRAASIASYLSAGFILLLICVPILRNRTANPPPGVGTFWTSGSAAARGENPYAANPETYTNRVQVLGRQWIVADFNLNPPCVLPLFQALSHLSIQKFAVVWTIGSCLLLFGTVALLMWHLPGMQKRQIVWLMLAASVFDTLLELQIYFLLFFLAALVLLFFDSERKWAAAIAIGLLVAIKPTLAFWPLFLYLGGHRKLALRSLAVTLAVTAAPLLFYGPSIYRQWFSALASDTHWLYPINIAIPAFFARLGLRSVGLPIAAILAAFLAWIIWKTKPTVITISGIAICAAILCAPLAWVDYTLVLAPYFVSRRWTIPSTAAAILLMVPTAYINIMSSSSGRLWISLASGIYLAAMCIILTTFLRTASARLTAAQPRPAP
jgi:Glycosyltransferase family 87